MQTNFFCLVSSVILKMVYSLHPRGSRCGHLQRDPPGHIHKRQSSSADPQHVFCSSLQRLNTAPEDHNQAQQHRSDPHARGSSLSYMTHRPPQTSGSGCQAPLVL